jgi:hypothetical protein
MDNIIKIIKSFQGDVFGAYVRETFFSTQNETKNIPIDVRIEDHVFFYMMHVFAIFFKVDIVMVAPNLVSLGLTGLDNTSVYKVNIHKYSPSRWNEIPINFDVDMLVTNANAVFIRPNLFLNFNLYPNKIELIKNRIVNRRFAIVSVPAFPSKHIMRMMHQANDMVLEGWVMDDIFCKKSTWVTNRWDMFDNSPQCIRTSYTENEIRTMQNQDQCSLCHEKFQSDNIVVNTCCNHNFHWKCCGDENSTCGLFTWFQIQDKFMCPYCRQPAICILK